MDGHALALDDDELRHGRVAVRRHAVSRHAAGHPRDGARRQTRRPRADDRLWRSARDRVPRVPRGRRSSACGRTSTARRWIPPPLPFQLQEPGPAARRARRRATSRHQRRDDHRGHRVRVRSRRSGTGWCAATRSSKRSSRASLSTTTSAARSDGRWMPWFATEPEERLRRGSPIRSTSASERSRHVPITRDARTRRVHGRRLRWQRWPGSACFPAGRSPNGADSERIQCHRVGHARCLPGFSASRWKRIPRLTASGGGLRRGKRNERPLSALHVHVRFWRKATPSPTRRGSPFRLVASARPASHGSGCRG